MPQNYQIHTPMGIYKHLQVSCTRHNVTQYIKSLPPTHLNSSLPPGIFSALQHFALAERGSSPRWLSPSFVVLPIRGLMSARAIHPRRWRPSHAIPCDVMIAIAICAGLHRHYLGQCDRCRVGHPNCAFNRTLMACNAMTPSRCASLVRIARAVNPSALSHSPASLSTYWTLPSRVSLFVVFAPKLPTRLSALYTTLVTLTIRNESKNKELSIPRGRNRNSVHLHLWCVHWTQ